MNDSMSRLVSNLRKNGFKVETFQNRKDAKEALVKSITVSESIGFGGSMTLEELGLYDDFKKRGNRIYWHWKADDKKQELAKAIDTDVYLTSTNALTLDGKLINMDGNGNRVASMIFGHKRVYIVIGKNKICKDYDEGIKRIKNIAAPKNGRRLNTDTPCRFTMECNDCSSKDRMCNVETIIHKNPGGVEINIFIINEELGY